MTRTLSVLTSLAVLTLAGCNMNPGGLSDEEWASLPPEERARLRIEQDQLNEQRRENYMRDYDRQQKLDQSQKQHDQDVAREAARHSGGLSADEARALEGLNH